MLPGVPCACRSRALRQWLDAGGGIGGAGRVGERQAWLSCLRYCEAKVIPVNITTVCVCTLSRMPRGAVLVALLFRMGVVGRWQHEQGRQDLHMASGISSTRQAATRICLCELAGL